MTDLVRMTPEESDAARQRVRLENTVRILGVLAALEPWVTGVMGPIQPNQVTAYLKGVRELGLLWDAYAKPAAVAVEESSGPDEDVMVLEARQAQVSAELDKLREVGMKRRGA